MLLSTHVSVPIIMSGLVLSRRFFNCPCFVFIDWKFIFRIFSGLTSDLFNFLVLSGVDECNGFMPLGIGLFIDVSDVVVRGTYY